MRADPPPDFALVGTQMHRGSHDHPAVTGGAWREAREVDDIGLGVVRVEHRGQSVRDRRRVPVGCAVENQDARHVGLQRPDGRTPMTYAQVLPDPWAGKARLRRVRNPARARRPSDDAENFAEMGNNPR